MLPRQSTCKNIVELLMKCSEYSWYREYNHTCVSISWTCWNHSPLVFLNVYQPLHLEFLNIFLFNILLNLRYWRTLDRSFISIWTLKVTDFMYGDLKKSSFMVTRYIYFSHKGEIGDYSMCSMLGTRCISLQNIKDKRLTVLFWLCPKL